MTAQVQVEGLADLARELKRIDPALNKQLRLVNKTVSDKVVTAGRPAIQGLPSPGGSVATAGSDGSGYTHSGDSCLGRS